ncbi:ABC transporter substrate-binding protein [Propionibacterium australiense]|uniref:Iron ABC transporter substrate-binding protein n=1 Tax=Propionibacterium australiense TaxID=119981 RepID=A0A8B3FTJ8_9ACTN|nr:ABC transporter substrate-binding protein [Propionibacterium australiense]RLP11101.1 iron ABC transporter substrate-binding protein [Propionibacterium australiense]
MRSSIRPGRLCATAAAVILCTSLVTACSSSTPQDASSGKAGVDVTDLTGARVHLDQTAQRVVTIPLPAASMLVAVDGTADHLVGMNSASMTAIENGFLGEAYPQLLDVPSDVAGTDFAPNMESIMRTDPDLVIQWGDEGSGVVDPLTQSGIPVAQITYGTQERIEAITALYGELLGKQDRARRIVDTMHERRAELERREPATTADGTQPSVLYLRGDKDAFNANGTNSYNHFTTELAGARDAAEKVNGSSVAVSPEQILAWDPDVILLGNFGQMTPEDLYNDPRFAELKAVQNRQVYKVPLGGYRWDPPSQESSLMWTWLAAVVRGESAPGLREMIADDYEFLYNKRPDDTQLDQILQTEANKDSANYADFGR